MDRQNLSAIERWNIGRANLQQPNTQNKIGQAFNKIFLLTSEACIA
jgi:hypothetical protein